LLCFSYGWHVVATPRLEQQHGGAASLRKATGNDGTGRARSADDKIVEWLKLCREPALIGLDAGVMIERFRGNWNMAIRNSRWLSWLDCHHFALFKHLTSSLIPWD